jgi:hypothetical protein
MTENIWALTKESVSQKATFILCNANKFVWGETVVTQQKWISEAVTENQNNIYIYIENHG